MSVTDEHQASEVMTVAEVAALLRLNPKTVLRGAERGDIPGRRVGRRWVFGRQAIMVWLARGTPQEV
jgi:excisionase family DNA binding protein